MIWNISNLLALSPNLTTVFVFIVVFLSLYSLLKKPDGIPPGSVFTLPIVGDLPLLLGKDIRKVFSNLRQKHGNVFSIYLGKELTIVINGYDLIHKAMINKANIFSDRPKNFLNNILEDKLTRRGIIMAKGRLWKEQRRFTHSRLKELGFGRTTFETNILKEVKYLVVNLKQNDGRPFDIRKIIHASIFDVMCSILIGKRFDYDDAFYVTLLQSMDLAVQKAMTVSRALGCFPFLRYTPVDIFHIQKLIQNIEKRRTFLKETYVEHTRTINDNYVRDFMDVYANEIKKIKNSSTFVVEQMISVFSDLFIASSETTATTMRWAIIYILNFPEIKERLQSDIDRVIPTGSFPCLNDKPNLPYVEAFILETLRFANIVPLAVPHATIDDRDVVFEGFKIPKGTTVIINLESVLFDPVIFENPKDFNPDRFLDENGDVIPRKELIPFGVGPRKCLGEQVAKMELFLYITTLLKMFDFLPPEGQPPPDVNEGTLGVTFSPHAFEIRAISR